MNLKFTKVYVKGNYFVVEGGMPLTQVMITQKEAINILGELIKFVLTPPQDGQCSLPGKAIVQ